MLSDETLGRDCVLVRGKACGCHAMIATPPDQGFPPIVVPPFPLRAQASVGGNG